MFMFMGEVISKRTFVYNTQWVFNNVNQRLTLKSRII